MIPVVDEEQKAHIEAVKALIMNEVNVKDIKFVDGDAGVLVKKVKCDFKKLGVYENSVYSNDINEPAEEWCVKTKISLEEALRLYARLIVNSPQTLDRIVGRKDYDRK